jgi:cell division protein FtsB
LETEPYTPSFLKKGNFRVFMSKKNYMLLGIIAVLAIFAPGYIRLRELRHQNMELLEQIDKIKQENKDLSHQVERLETDPFYIEKKARDKMGIGREGEVRYKFVYEENEQVERADDENR